MRVSGRTRIVGIIGHPITHTLSPLMHNAAFEALSLDYCYIPFEVSPETLEEGVRGLLALGVAGVNVTIPHKEKIIPFLDRLTPEAEQCGAVNLITRQGRELVGDNTDGQGFIRSFDEEIGVSLKGKRCLILGAGGAARAVSYQLAQRQALLIMVANRTYERAERLAASLTARFPETEILPISQQGESLEEAIQQADILVNATPVGMKKGDPPPLPAHLLRPALVVCDLLYVPPKTPLLQAGEKAGSRIMNGLGMLLHQGALSFEAWTGHAPPLPLMRRVLEAEVNFE